MKKPVISMVIAIFLLSGMVLQAENANDYIRKGNKNYKDKKYNEAEVNYRKSLDKDPRSGKGLYNLGDALYKQGNYKEAADKFNQYIATTKDKGEQAMAYHNLGNSLLMSKQYSESIDAYKKALRSNPTDKDTKYNLEYAKRMLAADMQQKQNQQQNKQQQSGQQQQKQSGGDDKNKDNKNDGKNKNSGSNQNNGDKNKDQKNDQNRNNGDGKEGKNDKGDEGTGKPKISKSDADRILNALNNEESKVQKKIRKLNAKRAKIEKNW